MYFDDSQRLEEEEEVDCDLSDCATIPQNSCSHGHRSSLSLQTDQGGSICLLCLANLISNPLSPTVHVSYALSQISQALSQPSFLHSFLTFHSHFLVSPLVSALFSFEDEPIARQLIDLIVRICDYNTGNGDGVIYVEFIARVCDRLSSGVLAWSRRQVYSLHCLGVLLNCQTKNPNAEIMNIDKLVSNLVAGLQLPSEEIRGEILFVLYKIFIIHYGFNYGDGNDVLHTFCPKLLHLSLEALMKTQSDDVRLNGVAFLTVLIQRGFLGDAFASDMRLKEDINDDSQLIVLFAEAIKSPLLSSDKKVQICTLDLLIQYLSFEGTSIQEIQVLVQENIADYVFEITRLSEKNDAVIKSCIRALELLSKAEESFNQRLAIGFTTLIPVVRHVAEVPFHPVQNHTLKLILKCISECPGIVSTSQTEELILILMELFKRHADGEMGVLSDAFIVTCSIFVAIIKLPTCRGVSNLVSSVREVAKYAILPCLHVYERHSTQLLHSLYMLKEVYAYCHEVNSTKDSSNNEFRRSVLSACTVHLLPWILSTVNIIEEELVLGVLETFQFILILEPDIMTLEFANSLASSSWFSFSFGCLGLFPSEKMKLTVYMILSSLVDFILESKSGQPIRDSALFLPADPADLLFMLGQKSSYNLKLSACQSAVLLMLYTSSLHDDRIADEKLVLASLEQYILVSNVDLLCGSPYPLTVEGLVNVYGFYRTLMETTCQISYNSEAEKILFQIVTECEWDLSSSRIHSASLKWLFQQEKIRKPLAYQILKFCQTNWVRGIDTVIHKQRINTQSIAQIVASGENHLANLLVCLLEQLMEEGEDDDIISVLTLMAAIINICPTASDQLCLCGIAKTLQALYYDSNRSYSVQSFMATSVLVFNIWCFTRSEILVDDEAWIAVIVKLLDCFIPKDAVDGWTSDNLLVIAILSLILHRSTNEVLLEASKTILLNTSLISTINLTIQEAILKGPALVDDDERTTAGKILIFVLLLTYFSLKSFHAVLPGIIDWETFLDQSGETQLSTISIACHNLCRLMYFGSPLIKLVSSHCLLELFSRLSDQRNKTGEKQNCTQTYLISVMAVLEGLSLHCDSRVATNCALCLAIIFQLYVPDAEAVKKSKWCQIIVEELAMSMAVPCLVSSLNTYKPAVHIAVALLKARNDFEWIGLLFDDACISSMIENVTATNLSTEIVSLFRELFNSDLLNPDHISSLSRVLQACRKRMYSDNSGDEEMDDEEEKETIIVDDLEEVCDYLIKLMLSESSQDVDSRGSDDARKRLLEEIEIFLRTLTVNGRT